MEPERVTFLSLSCVSLIFANNMSRSSGLGQIPIHRGPNLLHIRGLRQYVWARTELIKSLQEYYSSLTIIFKFHSPFFNPEHVRDC